jgi:antitoxin component YwqK of YwqJK toxin-antitoxin module
MIYEKIPLAMKVLITIFCSLIVFQLAAQDIKKEAYDNGSPKTEGAYTSSDFKTGLWKYHYPNGKLEAEGSYNGKEAGKTIDVIRKGRNSVINDKSSVRHGEWVFYYSNGQKKGTINYKDGCPQGYLTKWYKTGEKMEETEYIECKPIGNKKIWAREGWLKYETTNEGNGRSMEIEWYENKQKKSAIPYKNGQQYGRVKRWYETGQKEEDVMMKNTRVHGSYRSWYPDGNKQREFFSINNVMSGEYREWSSDGKLLWEIIEMTDETKISVKNYWPNGQVKMQGKSNMPESLSIHQWSQTREGYWTYWYKDNTVTKSEKYSKGQLLTVEMP